MQLPLIFSLLYFGTFMAHGGFGAYMFYRDPKSPVNRVFFALCIALAIWSFSFSIAVNAPDLETCLFWRRVASACISAYYGLILHFVILLTGHRWLTRHKGVQYLLYLPILIFVWVYSLSPTLAPSHYSLILTEIGWLKLSLTSIWDYLFNLYFMAYMLLFIKVLWDWYHNTQSLQEKRQAKMIVATFGLVFCLVILTFLIRLNNPTTVFPEIACIISLIPVLSCYYAMKKYYLMTDRQLIDINESDLILIGHHREKVFLYLSSFLMFGGCLNFVSQYLLYGNNFEKAFVFSAILCLTGFFLKITHIIIPSSKIKEYISIVIITLLIPLITFRFIEQSS